MKTYKQYLLDEARKNPDANPRLSVAEKLKPYMSDPKYFLRYSNRETVGVATKNTNNSETPNGVYVYPIKDGIKFYKINVKKDALIWAFPTSSGKNWVFILEAKSGINFLDLRKYSEDDYKRDSAILKKTYGKGMFGVLQKMPYWHKEKMKPGKKIWDLVIHIAAGWSDLGFSEKHYNKATKIFLKTLGYDGAIDWGDSIIHGAEPMQAVFFNPSSYKVVDKFRNEDIYKARERKDAALAKI